MINLTGSVALPLALSLPLPFSLPPSCSNQSFLTLSLPPCLSLSLRVSLSLSPPPPLSPSLPPSVGLSLCLLLYCFFSLSLSPKRGLLADGRMALGDLCIVSGFLRAGWPSASRDLSIDHSEETQTGERRRGGGRERINIKNRRSSEAIFFLKKYRDLGEGDKEGFSKRQWRRF